MDSVPVLCLSVGEAGHLREEGAGTGANRSRVPWSGQWRTATCTGLCAAVVIVTYLHTF